MSMLAESLLKILDQKITDTEAAFEKADPYTLSETKQEVWQRALEVLEELRETFKSESEAALKILNHLEQTPKPLYTAKPNETSEERAIRLAFLTAKKEALYAGIEIGKTFQEQWHNDKAAEWLRTGIINYGHDTPREYPESDVNFQGE